MALLKVACFFSPVAAADDEWINGDQQGGLFEALAEFRTADVHLFDSGSPRSGQGIGAHFSAYSFCARKKSKALAGGATPGFVSCYLKAEPAGRVQPYALLLSMRRQK